LVSLLQNLLFAQHVSGTIMPIIRSPIVIKLVAAYGTWRFGLQVVGLVWNCRLCVWLAGCFLTGQEYMLSITTVWNGEIA